MGILHHDLATFMIGASTILLKIRNSPEKNCRENQTNILCSLTFSENRAVYKIMWKI
jgi:hypothetical protein